MIECQFDIHPIGQGLFYTGQIGDFFFVYDCGSSRYHEYRQAAVNRTIQKNQIINLFVLSHFHEDHFNGLSDILDQTENIREIVLPYLHPDQRILLALQQAISSGHLENEYIQFLRSPHDFIGERLRETQITYLIPDDPVVEWPEDPDDRNEGQGWIPNSNPLTEHETFEVVNKNVRYRKHSSIYQHYLWKFKFYCAHPKADPQMFKNFIHEIESKHTPIEESLLENFDEIKQLYLDTFGEGAPQNSTSILCCHGPVAQKHIKHPVAHSLEIMGCHSVSNMRYPYPFLTFIPRSHPLLVPDYFCSINMHMLTGDAEICVDDLEQHFKPELHRIMCLLIPHHGSKSNWRRKFLDLMPHCLFWAASFGLGNTHKHPSGAVMKDIHQHSRVFMPCNECHGIRISQTIVPL